MTVPAFLETRLAELGGDVDALARALVAEGWHPKNVERVLGVEILADGGSRTSSPEGANASGARPAAAAAHAPAPRRDGSTVRSPRLAVAAPPRAIPSPKKSELRLVVANNPDRVPVDQRPPHLRPRMHPGYGGGVRYDDCVHVSACLGRALAADKNVGAVHCPKFCPDLTEATRDERIAEATAGKAQGFNA